jgi:hypothetical protein
MFSNTGITSVEIPNSVTEIGAGSFSSTRLTTLQIPSSVEIIGEGAFQAAYQLTTVTGGTGVTTIRARAFGEDFRLTSFAFGPNLESIGDSAFWDTSLSSVTIPASVVSIGASAFRDDHGYVAGSHAMTLTLGDGVETIGARAFQGLSLGSVGLPPNVQTIGDYAFDGALSSSSITLPAAITRLGTGVFTGNAQLTRVIFLGDAPSFGAARWWEVRDSIFGFRGTLYFYEGTRGWDSYYPLGVAYFAPNVTPAVPPPPTARAGVLAAEVSVQAANIGERPDQFTVTSLPDEKSCRVEVPETTCQVSGLRAGVSYTFVATATFSGFGTSERSENSNVIVPLEASQPSAPVGTPTSTPASSTPNKSAGVAGVKPAVTGTSAPTTPTGVKWTPPSLTNPLVASFPATTGTTYLITATLLTGRRASKPPATKGSCKISSGKATCAIKLKTRGTWSVVITPKKNGSLGRPVKKTVKV